MPKQQRDGCEKLAGLGIAELDLALDLVQDLNHPGTRGTVVAHAI